MFIKLGKTKVVNVNKIIMVDILESFEPNINKILILFDDIDCPIDMGMHHENDCNNFVHWLIEGSKS